MVIWIASCKASSVVDKGMSMRRQIFGSSSCSSMRSRAIRSLTAPFRRSSILPIRLSSPLKKALLTGFHSTAKHNATKAVSPSSETMRTI